VLLVNSTIIVGKFMCDAPERAPMAHGLYIGRLDGLVNVPLT